MMQWVSKQLACSDTCKTKLHGLSPQMNYTNRETGACQKS
jgi:hypothetical protein